MWFLFHGQMATSPVTYLMEGFFPNLSRHLSGRSRHVSDRGVKRFLSLNADCLPKVGNQDTEQVSELVFVHKDPRVAAAHDGPGIEQGSLSEGSTENLLPGNSPAEQLVAHPFISPHPLVTFAQIPTIYDVQSSQIVAESALDPEQPLSLKGDMSSSPESLESATESPSIDGSDVAPAQGLAPQVQAETPAQILRPLPSSSFGMC